MAVILAMELSAQSVAGTSIPKCFYTGHSDGIRYDFNNWV